MGIIRITNDLEKREDTIKINNMRDEQIFIPLIEKNTLAFYRVAKGILSSEEDVKDSIQNTILIIYRKIYTLKNIEFFKTWAIRILINECNKIYNKNRKVTYIEKNIEDNSYTSDIDSKIDLYDAISMLSEDLRIVTILFYFDRLSYREIAETLDLPEGTIKSRVFRAKEKLYEILKGKEENK